MADINDRREGEDGINRYGSPDEPLLPHHGQDESDYSETGSYTRQQGQRQKLKEILSSKPKHYMTLGLVALDVGAILADIFITLIACDLGKKDEEWVGRSQEILYSVGLVFSSLFLAELLVTVWAFGISFFKDWFHCFDAVIIVASFIIDVLTHGVIEEIASLVIILRLWRLVKIVEELSVGASEGMEEIEAKVEQLEEENLHLKTQMEAMRR